jgi:hypothetical protein
MASVTSLELSEEFIASRDEDIVAVRDKLLARHDLDAGDVAGISEATDKVLEALQAEPLLSDEGYSRQLKLMDAYLWRLAQITADRERYPEIAEVKIEKPIFITGLSRSGTTFLHSLLSRDPDNRCPLVWETIFPSPPPEAATYDTDPRIEQCAAYFAGNPVNPKDQVANADMQRKHMNSPLMAEEDNSMLRTSMRGLAMGSGPRILGYFHWLLEADNKPAYEIHKRWLQHLQWKNPRKRWVLKAPTHMHNLEALHAVYPDAQIVQCHRNPAGVISSMASLLVSYRKSFMTHLDPSSYALEQINYQSSGLTRAKAFRTAHPDVKVFDIGHKAIVSDAVGTAERIYAFFDIPFTEAARAALVQFVEENPKEKHGSHEHSIEELGLSKPRIAEIFADYIQEYGKYF